MDLAQTDMIRRLFHDGTKDAWDAMVAYIREAEEGSEK